MVQQSLAFSRSSGIDEILTPLSGIYPLSDLRSKRVKCLPAFTHSHPTIDDEVVPADETGSVTREENGGCSNIIWQTSPGNWLDGGEILFESIKRLVGFLGRNTE